MGRTDFLFAMPSLFTGAARAFDLGATFDRSSYNISDTADEADARALAADWSVVGRDLQAAIEAFRAKLPAAK